MWPARRFRFPELPDVQPSYGDDGVESMRIVVSWIDPHSGSLSRGTQWPDFDQVPAVGDTIVQPFADGPVDACEVVERYIYFDEDNEPIWHLIFKYVELKPGRQEAFHLLTMTIED
jgi:hypothetical protein